MNWSKYKQVAWCRLLKLMELHGWHMGMEVVITLIWQVQSLVN